MTAQNGFRRAGLKGDKNVRVGGYVLRMSDGAVEVGSAGARRVLVHEKIRQAG